MSVSKTFLIGHLGKDADIKQVNGKQVMNFSVAHSTCYKKADGTKVENTTWFNCAYWSDSAVGQYLKKGTMVCVEGEVSARMWENGGKSGVSLELRVFNVNLLAQPKEQSPAASNEPYVAPTAWNPAMGVDAAPF